jgi:hypothetical protein
LGEYNHESTIYESFTEQRGDIQMRLEFEDWLSSQKISQTADSLFHEAITCYKASAYRASLLLSYVGFQTVVKDRILLATCPTGISQAQWTNIRKNLIDDDKWETQAFDTVQTTKPASIFGLSDDITGKTEETIVLIQSKMK